MRNVILGIVCIIFSGYAYATVAHPENTDIVGLVDGHAVCFNNDGAIASINECNVSSVDEGYVRVLSGWRGGASSGINACGASAVTPVSDAACPFIKGFFANCTANEYVLVQTTKSAHLWAVKANGGCDGIATPETTGLVPCGSTDAFDPVLGCTPESVNPNPPVMSIKGGYIQLDTGLISPPPSHCNDISHRGRMVLDDRTGLLYVCTRKGWASTSLTPVP